METVRTYAQINESGNLILENLPFSKGEFVEVLVFSSKNETNSTVEAWKKLFKNIQKNPASMDITDEIIQDEIYKFRVG